MAAECLKERNDYLNAFCKNYKFRLHYGDITDSSSVSGIIKKTKPNLQTDKVISENTSKEIRLILEKVVTKGTARDSDFGGYGVGGKTGTAEKPNPIEGGYYENKVISTFASVFPISTGKFVMVVTLDEPENNFGSESYRYASKTAVPVAAKIISRVAPLLNLVKQ